MKLSPIIVGGLGALTFFECTYAYPGMGSTVRQIEQRVQERQRRPGFRRVPAHSRRQTTETEVEDPNEVEEPEDEAEDENEVEEPEDEEDVPVLIGDIKDGGTTPVGKAIARIILEQETGQSNEAYTIPGGLNTKMCKDDTCCVWAHVSAQLTRLFRGPSGRCNKNARAAIRLGFHDAGTWQDGLDFGGADGSIILAKDEISRPDNRGLQDIVRILGDLHRTKYKQYGVGVADLIQFAAKHAVVSTFPSFHT